MNIDQIKFNIITKLNSLFNKTKKIKYKNEEFDCFYLNDFFSTYSSLGFKCYLKDFEKALEQIDEIAIYNYKEKKIIAEKNTINENTIKNLFHDDNSFDIKKTYSINDVPIDNYNKNKISISTLSDLSNESNDFLFFKNNKKIKTNNFISNLSSNKSELINNFNKIKLNISEAFLTGIAIPISSFNSAMCQKHKISFNYKNVKCDKLNHKHGSLSKFLTCCDNITLLDYKINYCILKTNLIFFKKRLSSYLLNRNNNLYYIYLNMLIINIFPIKVTIPYDDIFNLFFFIYKKKLESLIPDFKSYLLNLKSQNLFLLNNNNISITPFNDKNYNNDLDINVFNSILNIEKNILLNKTNDIKINVKSSDVLKKEEADILAFSDLNIPKILQEKNFFKDIKYKGLLLKYIERVNREYE